LTSDQGDSFMKALPRAKLASEANSEGVVA
jgi:hypothetical protein